MQTKKNLSESQIKNDPDPTVELNDKPLQMHHFLTNKNKKYTPLFKNIVEKYGLDLNDQWNKELLPHLGRHPNEYHQWLLKELQIIDMIPDMNQKLFLHYFEINIRQPIINNPSMLYKQYWIRN